MNHVAKGLGRILPVFIAFFFIPDPASAQWSVEKNKEGILVLEKGNPVFFYQSSPKGHNGLYERNHYLHPLWNVDGTVLTEDFPPDHLHQRGIFWAWHQIWIDGKRIGDGWELKDFEQEVVHARWNIGKKRTGSLDTEVLWKSDLYQINGEKTPYLKENTTITVHSTRKNFRQVDFEIRLLSLVPDLKIGGSEDEKGYSGFSVRMKLPDDVAFSGSEGPVKIQNLAVSSPDYVNISATFENNRPGGVLILDHPENPGYPQPWILRSAKSMQNIKFPGETPVSLSQSDPLVLRYSIITYTGKLKKKPIKKLLKRR